MQAAVYSVEIVAVDAATLARPDQGEHAGLQSRLARDAATEPAVRSARVKIVGDAQPVRCEQVVRAERLGVAHRAVQIRMRGDRSNGSVRLGGEVGRR